MDAMGEAIASLARIKEEHVRAEEARIGSLNLAVEETEKLYQGLQRMLDESKKKSLKKIRELDEKERDEAQGTRGDEDENRRIGR